MAYANAPGPRCGTLPRVTTVCASVAGLLASLALIGWITDTPALRELVPGQVGAKINSVVGLLLVTLSWLLTRRIGILLALIASVLATLTMLENILDTGFGIDELLHRDPMAASHPGRASALSMTCLLCVALARITAYRRRSPAAQTLAWIAIIVAAVALLGYLYDVRELYRAQPVTTVSLVTALCSVLLAVAALAAVPDGVLPWTVRGTDAGAVLLRRLLPPALVGLPVIGLAVVLAYRISWLTDVATSVAVLVAVYGLVFGALTWIAARRISRIDRRRERAITDLVELRDDLERQVSERAHALRRHGGHIAVLEDRQRIAADLHDIVIQRLFAAGMYLQGAAAADTAPDIRERIASTVDAMDVAIRDLRHSIFELGGGTATPVDITTAVDDVTKESSRILGFRPDVTVDDPEFEAETVRDDLLAVLRESLANVARHAGASAVDVVVRSGEGQVSMTITDNGKGMGETTHSSGTRNMAERARRRGGDCVWVPNEPSGTRVYWHVPV